MLIAALGLAFQLQVATAHPGLAEFTGPWRLRLGDAAGWALPGYDDRDWDSVQVPASWTAVRPGYRGFGWYRARFVVGRGVDAPLALSISSVVAAYEVYVDGRRLGGIGDFPPDYRARSGVPLLVALPPAALAAGTHLVAIRVFSDERVGGLVGSVEVGALTALESHQRQTDLYLLGTALLILGIGVSQLFFWLRRPASREHVGIFLVCLFLGFFFIVWMPAVRVLLEPYVFYLRLYVALAAASVVAYCFTFRKLFGLEDDRVVASLMAANVLLVPVTFALPSWTALRWTASYVFNPLLLLALVVTLVLVVLKRRDAERHSRLLLWGIGILGVAALHDVLVDWGLLAAPSGYPWMILLGAVVFVSTLAMTTAEKFVDTETSALYDKLTGLYRREIVLDALSREIRRAARIGQPLSVIMLDVDRFKLVNDTLGHQAGDRVLAEVGRRLGDAGRAVDWLGRYGGEEFIAVLAGTDRPGALQAAERLRHAVSALPVATGRTGRTVTLSAGLATYGGVSRAEEWPTTEELVGAADAALYRAKNAGRDCVRE
jgi:diguanylate cyclase (GGDEF)-like protein